MNCVTSTLLFACSAENALSDIAKRGLRPSDESELVLYERLDEAEQACREAVLAISRSSVQSQVRADGRSLFIPYVPAESIRNLVPYASPAAIEAAGGYVTRRRDDRTEVLLIFRRGEWDLPKGKVDGGEAIEDAATREVREELGIEVVELRQPLGRTVHGYRHKGRYLVKTTHWFEMHVASEDFHPQKDEGIECVVWVPLSEAAARLGYESLRLHTVRITHLLS